ncbi:MAG TPA: aldo/keto reductase [Planctomycetota bacterium]|nr:aldo/keto reductase [Planctomycetota bacterium]
MDQVALGRTGLRVSRLAYGNMTFGSQVPMDEARRLVRRCLDAGINFFDTADVYNQGRAEEMLGEILGTDRGRVVLASKVRGKMGEDSAQQGLSRRWILKAVEGSLLRLKTDRLDVYYLHQPDYATPLEESLATMDSLVRSGKVLHIGVSNFAAWQMTQMMWICDRNGWSAPAVVQPMLNLLARGIEGELLPSCREFGLGVFAYNPLAGGLLTGKHGGGQPPAKGTRFDGNKMYLDRYWHPAMFEAVRRAEEVARSAGKSLVELSLQWCLQQPGVHGVILGATREEQLVQNIAAAEGRLDESTLKACDEVWRSIAGPVPKYNR